MKKFLRSAAALVLTLVIAAAAACSGGNTARSGEAVSAAETGNAEASAETGETGGEISAEEQSERDRCDQLFQDAFTGILSNSRITAHYLLRHPENYGVDLSEPAYFLMTEDNLTRSFAEDRDTLARVEEINRSKLDSSRLLTLRMLENALNASLLGEDCIYLSQPLSPEYGIASQLPSTLASYRLDSTADLEAVISYIHQMGDYFDSLIAFEKKRIEKGIPMDDDTIDRSIASIQPFLVPAEDNILVTSLPDRLDALNLSEEEKASWISRMTDAVNQNLLPAYTKLESDLNSLKGHSTETRGLAGYDGGTEYFRYLLASVCGEDRSPEELEQQIGAHLMADLTAMGSALQKTPSLASAENQVGKGLSTPEEILDSLKNAIAADFPDTGDTPYEIHSVPDALQDIMAPAFFYAPTLDGDEPNQIYINGKDSGTSLYATLAHEGYPGHLYQSAYFKKYGGNPLRRLLTPDGYAEGWGEYAQIYAYQLDPNLSDDERDYLTHQASATLGIYALLDLRLNYDGWSREDAADFLQNTCGITDESSVSEIYYAVVDSPCEYLKYYVGCMEITDFRKKAQEQLGDRYNATEFHRFILDMCGADFGIMRGEFENWLNSQGAEAS
jgi:uncharacterized protein (DUF885 family)